MTVVERQERVESKDTSSLSVECSNIKFSLLSLQLKSDSHCTQCTFQTNSPSPSDGYVKLSLLSSNGQTFARSKTSIRRNDPNPTFKETFMFQIAMFQLEDITLMVFVYHKKSIRRKESIGWFSLGKKLSSSFPSNICFSHLHFFFRRPQQQRRRRSRSLARHARCPWRSHFPLASSSGTGMRTISYPTGAFASIFRSDSRCYCGLSDTCASCCCCVTCPIAMTAGAADCDCPIGRRLL